MQNKKEKTDQELVSAALSDKHAFSEVVAMYGKPISRYVRRLGCTDKNDIDDLLQEIFIKVYINLNGYDPNLKFSSWLYRIAHNETISFFRKKNVRPNVLSSVDSEDFFENLADEADFFELSNKQEDADAIKDVLSSIDQKYKEVLLLRFLEEKSYTEISDILRIPEGTVATMISRGKKELKAKLEEKNIKNI